MITKQDLLDYNKFLMEVWNPNHLHIPFAEEAPRAYLDYRETHPIILCTKQLKKYNRSKYNGELIASVHIKSSGTIMVKTENSEESFYPSYGEKLDLENADDYDGDSLICMIQSCKGIDVSKY